MQKLRVQQPLVPPSSLPIWKPSQKRLLREIEILKTCRSKYIVSFMAMGTDPVSGNTLLFMERALGGDVWSGLRAKRLDWHRQGWRIALDVARGLVYLSIRKWVWGGWKWCVWY